MLPRCDPYGRETAAWRLWVWKMWGDDRGTGRGGENFLTADLNRDCGLSLLVRKTVTVTIVHVD